MREDGWKAQRLLPHTGDTKDRACHETQGGPCVDERCMAPQGSVPGRSSREKPPPTAAPRRRLGWLFLTLGASFALEAVVLRPVGLVLLWPAWSVAWLALGYLGRGARVLGKRPDGTLPWGRRWLLLPYL